MTVTLYGMTTKHCGKCESAKDKLHRLGINYELKSYEQCMGGTYHEGWQDDDSIDTFAARLRHGPTAVPLIREQEDAEDAGKFYDYSSYMKLVKTRKKDPKGL